MSLTYRRRENTCSWQVLVNDATWCSYLHDLDWMRSGDCAGACAARSMSGAMSRRDRDAPPHADASSLSTPSNTSQRRSVAVLGSSLPLASTRRATPGQASAPGSSSIVRRTHSAQGPLGSYRSLSRPRTTPVREESLLGKRSFSSTHLQDSEFSTPQTSLAKRPLVSSALALSLIHI